METQSINVLVVDDEKEITNVLEAYLQKEGYKVFKAYDGNEALDTFSKEKIDLMILDLMLPDLSGEEVCKEIRLKSQVPILMLTAKTDEENRINGLDIGADDYIIKPFSPREVMARVRAIMRRLSKESLVNNVIEFNNKDLIVDIDNKSVYKKGDIVDLTPTELKLLLKFSENVGRTFSREELVVKILGYDYEGFDRTIDTHIKNLRNKIEGDKFKYIKTVYGIGYKFVGG